MPPLVASLFVIGLFGFGWAWILLGIIAVPASILLFLCWLGDFLDKRGH